MADSANTRRRKATRHPHPNVSPRSFCRGASFATSLPATLQLELEVVAVVSTDIVFADPIRQHVHTSHSQRSAARGRQEPTHLRSKDYATANVGGRVCSGDGGCVVAVQVDVVVDVVRMWWMWLCVCGC